jgi:hypothetical protein
MARRGNGIGIGLVVLGIALLLSNLDVVDLREVLRFWPLILIAVGARMVFRDRGSGGEPPAGPPPPP